LPHRRGLSRVSRRYISAVGASHIRKSESKSVPRRRQWRPTPVVRNQAAVQMGRGLGFDTGTGLVVAMSRIRQG
jgi:hypothetical protein